MEIQNPRILGAAVSHGAVYLVSASQEQVQMLCFQGRSAVSIAGSASDDDDDEDDVFSELTRLSLSSTLSSEVSTKLVRSPRMSPGSGMEKNPGKESKTRRSSFLSEKPFRSVKKSKWESKTAITKKKIVQARLGIKIHQNGTSHETKQKFPKKNSRLTPLSVTLAVTGAAQRLLLILSTL